MIINTEKCEINKRRLVFNCDIDDVNYHFEYDDWDEDGKGLKIKGGVVIVGYKYCLQAYIPTNKEGYIFIDRQYKHNYSYDVYFDGTHYTVGSEDNESLIYTPKLSI